LEFEVSSAVLSIYRSDMKPLAECLLYAFVDTAYLHGRAPEVVAQLLCEGGADIIQLRAKDYSLDQIRRTTEAILPVTRAAGISLVINDHYSIAAECGAEFCHLGQEDFFDSGHNHTSQLRTPHSALRIGLSTHSPSQAERALKGEPDYIAIGPVFRTATKPMANPVTLDYVRWAAAHVRIPWFAIGGINQGTLPQVLEAGARRICVVSAILNANDIAGACREFKSRLLTVSKQS
jgi:thiamine-phosphate pyrophosphorylase